MDDITQRVRDMYERYPYPTKPKGIISDIHPGLLLSYLDGPLPSRPLRVLDAGCGTGSASLGTAMCNPQVEVTAADMNRTALAQVRQEASELKLANLQVHETDLMTLTDLPVPEGGFDVIFCSGVLHHLSDPARGLAGLVRLLAPRGVLRLMVYGTLGRQGLYRFVEALDALHPERTELKERLQLGRRLMAGVHADNPVRQPPWADAPRIDDVEFVDRYLNLNDRSYRVDELLDLVEGQGLQFLRWYEPRHWHLSSVCSDDGLCRRFDDLPARARWAMMERLSQRTQLDMILCHPQAQARTTPSSLRLEFVALSPQAVLRTSTRVTGTSRFSYHPTAGLREGEERPLTGPEKAVLEQACPGPVPVSALTVSEAQVRALLDEELLYRPAG